MTAALSLLATPAFATSPPYKVITGVMTGADHQTYREVPFKIPGGVTALTVEFQYTGREQKAVIDLGLRDPKRFRGWSGGNKARFTLTETWATPSYMPGPLPKGTWRLILGVPNLRKGERAEYTATITIDRSREFHGFASEPLKDAEGWYRGDLHLHTQHSDGSCASRTGKRTPCPVFRTLEAAAARGLDFVAISDHNTASHIQDLAELQGYYDDLLLIPAREVTTFQGHANVYGMTAPLDFQLGSPRAPDIQAILAQVREAEAVIAINHPSLPSGEACMGCGWTATNAVGPIRVVEVINGAVSSGPLSGLAFWEKQLNGGQHVTAIGGSDNHDPGADPARGVGVPTTVVHAASLSHDAILQGVRQGHVYIDAKGTRDRTLSVLARTGEASYAGMGDTLFVARGAEVRLEIQAGRAEGGRVVLSGNYEPATAATVRQEAPGVWSATFPADGRIHWVRADIVGPDGTLWLLGNPIYLAPASVRTQRP